MTPRSELVPAGKRLVEQAMFYWIAYTASVAVFTVVATSLSVAKASVMVAFASALLASSFVLIGVYIVRASSLRSRAAQRRGEALPAGTAHTVSISVSHSTSLTKPEPMTMVDVVRKLDNLAGKESGLDWKVSIVDLLKLLAMDSSLRAREELATELGCPPDLLRGEASTMNAWLHKTLLRKIAENGGNIPPDLLKKHSSEPRA